jgi:endoglucanase
MAEQASEAIANPELPPREFAAYLKQAALDGFFGGFLQPEYASAFRGLSESDIDRVLASFALANCRRNEPLLGLVRKHVSATRS